MVDFTRLTILADSARADVVVASDQPLATLLPRLVEIVDYQGSMPATLIKVSGDSVDLGVDCANQELLDGEVLRIIPRRDMPSPPLVVDVTEAVADQTSTRIANWGETAKQGLGVGLIGVSTLLAGLILPLDTGRLWALGGALVVLLALSVLVRSKWFVKAASAAAVGLTVPTAMEISQQLQGNEYVLACLISVLFWLVIAGIGFGLKFPPALFASIICGLLGVLGAVLTLLKVDVAATNGILGVAAVVLLGILPAWAMTAAGLTGLDDRSTAGNQVYTDTVEGSVDTAFRMMSWAVVGLSVIGGGSAIVLSMSGQPWATALSLLIVAVLLSRARTFPGAVQTGSLIVAGFAAAAFSALVNLSGWWLFAAFLGVAGAAVVLVGLRPPEHLRIRARGLADGLELLFVIALLPVLLGVFGVYPTLLGAF